MRSRKQIMAEVKSYEVRHAVSRFEAIKLEVLLDIRDGLYEDKSTENEGIEK
jgi:hypothetical protein